MTKVRVSTTVEVELLERARAAHAGPTDASLLEAALEALLREHRAGEVDRAYLDAYRAQPMDTRDERGRPGHLPRCRGIAVTMELPGRGELWWADLGEAGSRPVVVVSRDAAIQVRRRCLVAPCSTVIRGLPSEVLLEAGEEPVHGIVWLSLMR